MTEQKRIGIFGGSFDPVHCGHLELGELARKQLGLDTIYFVPAKCPPHKLGRRLAPVKDRLKMLKLCIGARDKISRFELDRSGTTYTWQTLKYFKGRFRKAELFFILGGDSVNELGGWKKPELISKLCTIAAGVRAGDRFAVPVEFKGRLIKLRGKIPQVSSTDIRQRVQAGKPFAAHVEKAVAEYILKHHLYENIE
jgi:nicotinate-nucleotide adenylyltransferase